MKTGTKLKAATAVAAAGALLAVATPAFADPSGTQAVSGTVPDSITLTLDTPTVTLPSLDPAASPATAAGGTVSVSSNTAYELTVAGTNLTSTDPDGSLATPLAITDTATGTVPPTGLATASPVVTGGTGIGAGAGLSDTPDVYTVSFSQTVTYADAPGAYSTTLTYTAAAATP